MDESHRGAEGSLGGVPHDGGISMLLCGMELNLGDYVKVEYTTGRHLKGGHIRGKIIELLESHRQARLESGWCFHDHDKVLEHIPVEQ